MMTKIIFESEYSFVENCKRLKVIGMPFGCLTFSFIERVQIGNFEFWENFASNFCIRFQSSNIGRFSSFQKNN